MFKESVFFYRRNLALIAGTAAVPFALGALSLLSEAAGLGVLLVLIMLLSIVAGVLSKVAFFVIASGKEEPNGTVSVSKQVSAVYKSGLHSLFPFLWVNAYAVLAGLGGLFLFFIPGIIIWVLVSLSAFALFVDGRRGIEALASSWYYVREYWWDVFWRFLFFGIIILGSGLLLVLAGGGFGFMKELASTTDLASMKPQVPYLAQLINSFFNNFIFLPLGAIYPFLVYKDLKKVKPEPDEATLSGIKKKINIFIVVASVGIILLLAFAGFAMFHYVNQLMSFSSGVETTSLLASFNLAKFVGSLPW